ncbi:aspartate aminotransferase family protein [Ignavibacterium sp.]|uniref:aspartate aminotransferase family protein n=1 Tax=Ignavibacterium sp. TaxID=2651167 RepID=UPI00307D3D5D
MTSMKKKSEEIFLKACKYLPGGISRNTIYREPHPDYVESSSGCYITDIDGRKRIDFANNMASLIHGHAHPEIVEAVINQLKKGTAYTMASQIEVDFAELLCSRAESFQKIRFMNSGTEAVMAMIKLSRAFTGKSKIAKAEGAYHGTYDFAEVSQTSNPDNWGNIDLPEKVPVVKGTPKSVLDEVIIFPYNDIERTLSILNKHKSEIACVLIDPVPHRVGLIKGNVDFIEALYQWTRENNSLLVFDEVVTFRVEYGGAQQLYPFKPDLTALGKIIGGGFPIGALAGRSDILELMNPRFGKPDFPHSGTFSANPIAMTAGYTAMKLFDKEAVSNLNKLTSKAVEQIYDSIKIADVPVSITGSGSMFRIHFKANPPNTYRESFQSKKEQQVIKNILDYLYNVENLLLVNTCTCMFSTAISQHEVDYLSEAFLSAFKKFKDQIIQI